MGGRYGYQGFYDKQHKPVVLTRKNVDGIQLTGGTILGTSRGGADIKCVLNLTNQGFSYFLNLDCTKLHAAAALFAR